MAWTTPKTWTSEPLTSSDLNLYLRDNQNHIHDRQETNARYDTNESADYTTTSTIFVDIDSDNLKLTITTHGGEVLVGFFAATTSTASGADRTYFELDVDGSPYAGDDGLIVTRYEGGSAGHPFMLGFVIQIPDLSAASHVFKMQWKTSAGTAKLWAGAGTSNYDLHPQFWAQEI